MGRTRVVIKNLRDESQKVVVGTTDTLREAITLQKRFMGLTWEERRHCTYTIGDICLTLDNGEDEVRLWSVWTEGYSATGEEGTALYHGHWNGRTFAEACAAWVKSLPEDQRRAYNERNSTYWGCRFFDNEADARKSFG